MAAARHLRRRMPQEREDAQLLRECRSRLVYMHGTVHNEQCTYACGEREDLAVQIFCYSYHFYYGTIAPRVGRAAVYAEAVRSPTVLCPSVRPLYCAHSVLCALSICLAACLSVCLSLGQGVPADGCGMRRRRRYSGDGGGGE